MELLLFHRVKYIDKFCIKVRTILLSTHYQPAGEMFSGVHDVCAFSSYVTSQFYHLPKRDTRCIPKTK